MNTQPIRIKQELKTDIDKLMVVHTKAVYDNGSDEELIKKFMKYGLSYNDFLEVLVEVYKKSRAK